MPSAALGWGMATAFGVLAVLMFRGSIDSVGFFALAAAATFVYAGLAAAKEPGEHGAAEREIYEQARWYEGRYLLPEDFDEEAGHLLARAQRAVRSVLDSHVNAEGLLDDVRNAVMLPEQEWEIARLLARLSSLRSEHRDLVSGGMTPEVAAAAVPLDRALVTSEAAVVARVQALEGYAGHVADAERAYHAHAQIDALRERLPRYEELLAEAGADRFAVQEIERFTDDADQLDAALRDSVRSAHEAFRYLDGPERPGDG